jgi:uncharacterized membrane protein YsdA (DUF1294 family)
VTLPDGLYPWVVLWVVALSVLDFVLAGFDKHRARHARRRVPERTLLGIAFLGGTLGLAVGMVAFHHKTRKGAFLAPFVLIVLLQVGFLILVSR